MQILVTGGTGYIGSTLTADLINTNDRIRCLSRNVSALKAKFPDENIEFVEADLNDEDSLQGVFEGVDVAYYLVHSLSGNDGFRSQELLCAANFSRAAFKSGVKKIIYLGGLGASNSGTSRHLQSRSEVGEILRNSGVPCLEFQASIVIGPGGLSYEIMKNLVIRLPIMITPKWVSSLAQPIWLGDCVQFLLQSRFMELKESRVIQIGGPEVTSYRGLMKTFAKMKGLTRAMIPVPVLTPNLSSRWLGLVTPVYARVGRKLIESLKVDSIISDETHMKEFDINPIGFREAIQRTIEIEENEGVQNRWFDSVSSGVSSKKITFSRFKKTFTDERSMTVNVNVERAFEPINAIGGGNGWYYGNWLWIIRGWIDLIFGGVGLRRTRRKPEYFVVGDTLDWWRVMESEPNARVKFQAEMRLPGSAWLEFQVSQFGDYSRITQTAGFTSNGLIGNLYWYSLLPLHKLIFKGMINKICKKAESVV